MDFHFLMVGLEVYFMCIWRHCCNLGSKDDLHTKVQVYVQPHGWHHSLRNRIPALPLNGSSYVPLNDWWKYGFICSVANLFIWLGVGGVWWEVIGL